MTLMKWEAGEALAVELNRATQASTVNFSVPVCPIQCPRPMVHESLAYHVQ